MINLNVILLAIYAAMSLYYLRIAALPELQCNPDQDLCARSLFPPTRSEGSSDVYSIELWILDEVHVGESDQLGTNKKSSRRKLEWAPLSTCPPIDFVAGSESEESVISVYTKHKFGGKDGNCTLDFPSYSRVRLDENFPDESPQVLKAKFVLKQRKSQSPDLVIAQTIFDLTRLVELRLNSKVPHFKYNGQPIVLRLVADDQKYHARAPVRGDGLKLVLYQPYPNQRDKSENIYHRPAFYIDDVALKYASQIQLADPVEQVKNPRPPITLKIHLSIISPMRHVLHRQLGAGFDMLGNILNADELDEIRHMVSDEYMYRFILTQIITFIHIYLDYMAFRDEVGFYVGKTSMGGISMSSVVGRFICQFIIFLYLCDGGNTSWLVLGSIGSGCAVELWKVSKFFHPKITPKFPFISMQITSEMTSLERDTMNYDSIARRYLGLILYPLVCGSAIYAKKFYTYSSWWSWLISNLANAVYTFGFITLCPQLYVNYRLKSVAHLPWKVFVYKIFNTFVDDVFAFMIQMPLKHKLMTLRDDVVFVIFLVQAYIYRVDKSRTNEFGYSYDDSVSGNNESVGPKEHEKKE